MRKRLSKTAWTGLDRLNFEHLFPALLFTAAAARLFAPARFPDFTGASQTAWRFNTAMGFVAVATLITCLGFGADPAITATLTVFAALPTASASHVLSAAFGADRRLTATIVAQGTLLATITLPLWILVFEALA